MKKKIISILICTLTCVSLCACDADEVNMYIDAAGQKLQEVEVKQEDLDKLNNAAGELKDAVGEIVNDPDVQEALKSGADAVADIVKDSEEAE